MVAEKESKKEENIYREYLLAELRCTRLRFQLIINEIDACGMALKKGLVNEDEAVVWMNEIGALELLQR